MTRRGPIDPADLDPQELARDWITLWQSELAALSVDQEAQESWQALLGLWANAAGAMLQATKWTTPDGAPGAWAAAAPRAAAAAAAPDLGADEVERLARRVAELERRLAELERGGS
jgi:hypothetical protein